LPYRQIGRGGRASLEVLLVTSRQTGRWVVPKGNLMLGKAPHEAAAIEAEEEAGVRGAISPVAFGQFRYRKILSEDSFVFADIDLFALAVEQELASWKEMGQRERRWFSIGEAAIAVDEVELGELIHRFGEGRGPLPG